LKERILKPRYHLIGSWLKPGGFKLWVKLYKPRLEDVERWAVQRVRAPEQDVAGTR
jgi:hypothetical protein